MNIKVLSFEEITEIFNNYMPEAFPKDEIRPLSNIKMLFDGGHYIGLGGYDNDELKIYGLFCIDKDKKLAMLDYFATTDTARGKGYGSEFMSSILNNLEGIKNVLLEVEDIDFSKDEHDKLVRERRIGFYKRNNCKLSNIKAKVYTVNFSIMYLSSDETNDDIIENQISNIYDIIFPSPIRETLINIFR